MAIFSRKNTKDEYWFVPNGTTTSGDNVKEKKKATPAKATEENSKSAVKASTAKKSGATASANKVQKPKATVAKTSTASVATPATKAKKAPSNNVSKTTSAPVKKSTEQKASTRSKTKSAVNKVANTSKSAKAAVKKKDSNIVTLTAANEIPKSVYYDEEEAEKLARDTAAENVELKGYGGTFEIKKSRDNRYVFNLFAANHLIIATSRIYSSAQNAQNGINSVIATAERASVEDQTLKTITAVTYPKWEIYIDRGNQYRFRLHASNGICICHSQVYTTKASCKNGIESIIRTVKNVKIDKSYLK